MFVYLFYDKNDELLYIGKTISMKNRMKQHKSSSKVEVWKKDIETIKYYSFDNQCDMSIYEIWLISKHRPKYNKEYMDLGMSNLKLELPKSKTYYEGKFDSEIKQDDIDTSYIDDYKDIIKENLVIYEPINNHKYTYNKLYEDIRRTNITEEKLLDIKNDISNYFKNKIPKVSSKNMLWTTFPEWFNKIKGKGLRKNFIYMNDLVNPNREEISHLMFVADLTQQLIGGEVNKKIVTILVDFIMLSNIKNEKVTLYLPSKKMRSILNEWLDR